MLFSAEVVLVVVRVKIDLHSVPAEVLGALCGIFTGMLNAFLPLVAQRLHCDLLIFEPRVRQVPHFIQLIILAPLRTTSKLLIRTRFE